MEAGEVNQNSERIQTNFKPWGEVTSPREHKPDKFRYLVHGINPIAPIDMAIRGVMLERDHPGAVSKEDGDQTINMFSQPERLGERVSLSCSLIDQGHSGTWGEAGLIIEAPSENICITSPSDGGVWGVSKKLLEEQASQNVILTAEELLASTTGSYNEVVVLANKGGKKAHLAGFFYKTTDDGEPINEALAEDFMRHAKRLNLPIVPINEPNPYGENKVINNDNSLCVQFKGKFHYLRGPEYRFMALGQKESTFLSPDEIEEVLKFLQENGINESDIAQLRQEYKQVDEERQGPKVRFDKQGKLQYIEKHSGYGRNEKVMRVYKPGDTYQANIYEENKKVLKKRAGNYLYGTERETQQISSKEVESIVQQALQATVSEEERQKIEAWWHKGAEENS